MKSEPAGKRGLFGLLGVFTFITAPVWGPVVLLVLGLRWLAVVLSDVLHWFLGIFVQLGQWTYYHSLATSTEREEWRHRVQFSHFSSYDPRTGVRTYPNNPPPMMYQEDKE